jgi:hypothetical protein
MRQPISLSKLIFETTLGLFALFFLAYWLDDTMNINSREKIIIWFFYGVSAYLIIGAILIFSKRDFEIFEYVLTTNVIIVIVLLAGYITNLFTIFSWQFSAIFGWPAIASFGILMIMTLVETIFYFFAFRFVP